MNNLTNITPEQITKAQELLAQAANPAMELWTQAFNLFVTKVQVEAIAWFIISLISMIFTAVLTTTLVKRVWVTNKVDYDNVYWREHQSIDYKIWRFFITIIAILALWGFSVLEFQHIISNIPTFIWNIFAPEVRVIIEVTKLIK